MVRKIIKISEMDTSDHIHDLMGSFLELPRYYGRNFDALFDVLTDISERTDIAIDYEGKTLREIPACALTGLRVLFDAAMVTPALRIVKPEDIVAEEAAETARAAEAARAAEDVARAEEEAAEPVAEARAAVGSEVIAENPAELEGEPDAVIEPAPAVGSEDAFEPEIDVEIVIEPEAVAEMNDEFELAADLDDEFEMATESDFEYEPDLDTEPAPESDAES